MVTVCEVSELCECVGVMAIEKSSQYRVGLEVLDFRFIFLRNIPYQLNLDSVQPIEATNRGAG